MIVANKNARRQSLSRTRDVSALGVFTLSLLLIGRWVEALLLRAHLRSLERMADYFAWQQENGAAGLADTHKRIAMAKSELRQLQDQLRC